MISAKTQWRIFGVAFLAMFIFILVYIGVNRLNGLIFILPVAQQPLALLLAALIVAPLVLPFILPYIRLTSVKAFGIEIALAKRLRQNESMEISSLTYKESHVSQLSSFVNGISRDYAAVRAAFSLSWNNRTTEGHVNR